MPTPSSLFPILIALAGLIVFLDALVRITQQFSKRTPWMIRGGMVLIAVGSLAFLHNPLLMGGMFIIGRALLLICGRGRGRWIFQPRQTDSP